MARSKAKPDADRAGSIYRTLRHAIIEQALAPGAKLPEDAIGERFDHRGDQSFMDGSGDFSGGSFNSAAVDH